MSELIQGYKHQCNINSMDFNRTCTHFATGGKDYIRIFSLSLTSESSWFKLEKTYGKYRGTNQTKANVSQLAWTKQGREALAIGTSSGLVLVYDAEAPYKNIMQTKGHEGDIKNIQWNPGTPESFVTSCFDNEIIEWDMRTEKLTAKYELSESTKIRDLKFSPHRPWQLAVQSSTKLEILDLRKTMNIMATYEIVSNELHGIGVKWDPVNPHRLASAISKEISVFDISSGQFEKVDSVSHYSLIKSFHWMRTKPSFFGIMCDKPEKYIVFYDLEDRNRLAYYYGGHQRPMDCWIMNEDETVLVSASNHREKAKQGLGTNLNSTFLVAQHSSNCLDPNEAKFNHPLTFNNDSELAFCLNLADDHKDPKKKSSSHELRPKERPLQTTPAVYHFRDRVEWFERERDVLFPLSFKQEVVYLAKNYLVDGDNHKLALNNAEVALRIGKSHCAEMWKNLFQICFPEKEEPTMQAIYERKMRVNVSVVDSRVILHDQEQSMRSAPRIDISALLQWLVDEHNQLQTAALAAICLLTHAPEAISPEFADRVWKPYIQLLYNLELFEIASESILLTRTEKYTAITGKQTKYNLTCGSCKLSVSKGECKCNLLCVLCEERLDKKLVIWCKYCGHGGHAAEYEQWFKIDKHKECPHGCGHACFS